MSEESTVQFQVRQSFPVEFVKLQILLIRYQYNFSNAAMAEIAGMERSNWHRLLKSKAIPSLDVMYRLSLYFKLPMTFWFPESQGEESSRPSSVMLNQCGFVNYSLSPTTRMIVKKIGKLPVADKRVLIALLESDCSIESVLELANILTKCKVEKAKRLLKAMITIASEN